MTTEEANNTNGKDVAEKDTDTALETEASKGFDEKPEGSEQSDTKEHEGGASDTPEGGESEKPAEIKAEDFTLPENMELDQAAFEKFIPIAAELNLDQEQSQKLLDIQVEAVTRITEAYEEKLSLAGQEFDDARAERWETEAKADPDFSEESLSHAGKFVNVFGDDELKEALDESGFGNHKAVIRAFAKVGKLIGDNGKFIHGNASATEKNVTMAEAMYKTK